MQGGEAVAALHHPEVGDIDLIWGKEGTGKSDGYGLAKLVKYHPEVVDDLQGIYMRLPWVITSEGGTFNSYVVTTLITNICKSSIFRCPARIFTQPCFRLPTKAGQARKA